MNMSFIKENRIITIYVLTLLMGYVAFWVPNRPIAIGVWIVFALLSGLLTYLEQQDKKSSRLNKFKDYLKDYKNWSYAGDSYYYTPKPEYTMKERRVELPLEHDFEWVRGEIGYHYKPSGGSTQYDLLFNGTVLRTINIVAFDGLKKSIVSPDWTSVNGGRFYYYVSSSIEYALHIFFTNLQQKDSSKGLKRVIDGRLFDIPVFKKTEDLRDFTKTIEKDELLGSVATDKELQNKLFIELLDNYGNYTK